MTEMISRWIKETKAEIEKARSNKNDYKLYEMNRLLKDLRKMRDDLLISMI